jgi:hypothetical protein
MTSGKHRKRLVRQRTARTGESYTTALRHIRSRQEGHMSTSSTPSAPEKVLASCTFCGTPSTQVKKIIAGPGVYICDECVGLCQSIITTETSAEESASMRASFENRPESEVLNFLPGLLTTLGSVEADLRRWVLKLRYGGTSWETIASTLKMDPETVRSRFERPEP